jgi:hypothetical protein
MLIAMYLERVVGLSVAVDMGDLLAESVHYLIGRVEIVANKEIRTVAMIEIRAVVYYAARARRQVVYIVPKSGIVIVLLAILDLLLLVH